MNRVVEVDKAFVANQVFPGVNLEVPIGSIGTIIVGVARVK
jgi:hypothetical protein